MCIAIVKPIGVEPPNVDILKNCFNNNSDGAGFAFSYNNKVIIKKGFMKFDDFMSAFNTYNEKYNFKERGMLIHFRIATHGGVNQSMTHPFPIQSDNGALQKIEYVSDYAVIHNGTISLTSSATYKETTMSDTAVFIRDYLYDLSKNKNWFYTESNIDLIEKLIDSKMAILNKKGDFIKTHGFEEENGVFYSNSTYKENRYKTSRTPSKYDYAYMDDYEDGYFDAFYNEEYSGWKKSDKTEPTTTGTSIVDVYKNNNNTLYLMKLPINSKLYVKDDLAETVAFCDKSEGIFMDSDGNIYYGTIDTKYTDWKTLNDRQLPFFFEYVLISNGVAKNEKGEKIEFVGDVLVYKDQIDGDK